MNDQTTPTANAVITTDNYVTEDLDSIRASMANDEQESSPELLEAPVETDEDKAKETITEKPKRRGRLERELAKRDAEIAALRAERETFTKSQLDKSEKPVDDGAPKMADYEDVMDYYDARQDWKVKQALKEVQEQKAQAEIQAEVQERIQDFNEREAAIIAENPEYTNKLIELHEDGYITDKMVSYMREESDVGEKIALHLTKFPGDAATIAQLNGKQFEKAMWALEHFVSKNEAQSVEVKTTKAPQPIKPVRTNATSSKDPGEMDFDEYRIKRIERRKAQGLPY